MFGSPQKKSQVPIAAPPPKAVGTIVPPTPCSRCQGERPHSTDKYRSWQGATIPDGINTSGSLLPDLSFPYNLPQPGNIAFDHAAEFVRRVGCDVEPEFCI